MYESANDPRTANDRSRTANDPQIGPQMIPDRKWSLYWTANINDPDQKSSVRIKSIMGYISIAELWFPYDRRIADDRRK